MSYATLEEFKAHARIGFDDDDDLIEGYLDSATDFIRPFLVDDPDGDSPPSEPSHDLKQATLLIASSWYERRETSIDVTLREIPYGARDIINQIRSWNFG